MEPTNDAAITAFHQKSSPFLLVGICIAVLALVFSVILIIKHFSYQNINTYPIVYKNNTVQEGATQIISQQGDRVTFIITSDIPRTFRVLGYSNQISVPKNIQTQFTITSDQPGHFDYGFIEGNVSLGSLDVSPKQ